MYAKFHLLRQLTNKTSNNFSAGVIIDFLQPLWNCVEASFGRNVVNDYECIRRSVVALCDWTKPLLASSVPYLQLQNHNVIEGQ